MGQFISFMEKEVSPQGININAFPDETKIKQYLFKEDYQNLILLRKIPPLTLAGNNPLLFYPGCGADILFPLLYLDHLFPHLEKVHLLLLDVDPSQGMIKTILHDLGISFAEEKNILTFYWKKKLVTTEIKEGNAFTSIKIIPPFDLYFERAFRIMKDEDPKYENNVMDKLKSGGILISDSGFKQFTGKKIKVSKKLSVYGEMIISVKEPTATKS